MRKQGNFIVYTSVYGGAYVPFLRVLLASLRDNGGDPLTVVEWDEIPETELVLLRRHFPDVMFQKKEVGAIAQVDSNRRISMYVRYWSEFIASRPENDVICCLDADMIVMSDLSELWTDDSDIVFTWKPERFPINAGVIMARNVPSVRAFFAEWLTRTEATLLTEEGLRRSLEMFGAADQYAFAELLTTTDYTRPFTRSFGSGPVRFTPVPCAVLNETNCRPVGGPQTPAIFHMKSGWHGILLRDAPYTKWRTKQECQDLENYWKNIDTESMLAHWRSFALEAAKSEAVAFTGIAGEEYVDRGILNSEMLVVVALIRALGIEVVVESGRYLGQSTRVLAESLPEGCILHSIELSKNEIALQAEERLRPYADIRLHYGDSRSVIPAILEAERGKRIALLLDGPKGPDAFQLLSDSIASHSNVLLGFVHDLRNSHPGMLNPNRVIVHEYFERIFFTDDEEYIAAFRHLDVNCIAPSAWAPNYMKRRKMGSYGPTLGAILPTWRDRYRATARLSSRVDQLGTQTIQLTSDHEQDRFGTRLRPGRIIRSLHRRASKAKSMASSAIQATRMVIAPPKGQANADPPPETVRTLAKCAAEESQVSPSDIVIDLGTRVGDVTARFVGSGAMIYAFEPDPIALSALNSRFAGCLNVVCFPLAALDREAPETGVIDLSNFIRRLGKRVRILAIAANGPNYDAIRRIIGRGVDRQIDHMVVELDDAAAPSGPFASAHLAEVLGIQDARNVYVNWA